MALSSLFSHRCALLLTVVMAFAALPVVAADAAMPETLPSALIVTAPLHWTVEELRLRLPEGASAHSSTWSGTNELVLYSRKARATPFGSCRGASATASPYDRVESGTARGHGLAQLQLFGSGEVMWERQQRLATRAFLANPVVAARGVELLFEVHFRNFSSTDHSIRQLSVPIMIGGRRLALAQPLDESLYERGIAFPASDKPRAYAVTFVAHLAPERIGEAARGLEQQSPAFAFENGEGQLSRADDDNARPLADLFADTLERSVAIRVHGGKGEVLVWRVMRQMAGRTTTLADWAAVVNHAAQELYQRPLVLIEEGVLLSLAGWDTGAWERWWHLAAGRNSRGGVEGTGLRRDITFILHETPPPVRRPEMERLRLLADDPIALGLLAEVAAEQRLELLQEAASYGYAPALTRLANLWQPEEPVRAAELYQQAAAQHYGPAQTALGRALLQGHGVTAERQLAFGWLAQAALQGEAEGGAAHAICLIRGFGVAADPLQGMVALRQAANRGSATAQYALGLQLLEGGSAEGANWLNAAAEAGNAKAQLRYARYLSAAGSEAYDPVAAAGWFYAAAEAGEAEAQLAYGLALRNGNGVRRDRKAALNWIRRAANQKNSEAQTWLGMLLLREGNNDRERAEGVNWIEEAAAAGQAQAQHLLGLCHYAGFGGVEQDHETALRWFKSAAEQQILPARLFVAFCHYKGLGTAQDRSTAFQEFAAAAEAGSPEAQIWVAHCYINGEGVTTDLRQAREWAQKAWRQGHPGGHRMLRKIPRE